MTVRQHDPLLSVARLLLGLAAGVFAIGAGALTLAIPVIVVMRDAVMKHLATQGTPPDAFWAIVAIMTFGAVAAALGFFFFRHLFRIVGSVGQGDAFTPVNAERLSAMGWISVVVHVLGIPVGAVAHWVEDVSENFSADFDVSPSGILLALILFILARVFRQGAAMREELEGTV